MASVKSLLTTASVALPLAGAALTPAEAEACSVDPCYFVDLIQDLAPINAASIPIDGVLLLQATQTGDSPDADWLATIDLTVTRDGQPIAGALETSAIDNILVWRPAAPLEPGALYKVTGTLDNPDVEPYYEGCAPDLVMLDFDLQAGLEPSTPLAAPEVEAAELVNTLEILDALDAFVCCDDAFPFEYSFDCGGSGTYVSWDAGFCAPLAGVGVLSVQVAVTPSTAPATAALLSHELVVDGAPSGQVLTTQLGANRQTPFCTEVVQRNLATGEQVKTPKQCHGDAVAPQLGPQDLDPGPTLARKCQGEPYTCVAVDGRWDPAQCTPWPAAEATTSASSTDDPSGGGETASGSGTDTQGSATAGEDDLVKHGCVCDARRGAPPGGSAVLLLALLARRRRAPRRAGADPDRPRVRSRRS